MTLTQLNYVYWIDRCGSFRRAAKEAGVSQPTVTGAIHALEEELNHPIFIRRGSRSVLTDAGRRVLRTALLFRNEEARLMDDLGSMDRSSGKHVRVAVCLYTSLPLRQAEEFGREHPGVEVNMDQCNALHVIEALDGEECDLGITYTELLSGRESGADYGRQEFGVFFPPGHEFSGYDFVPQKEVLEVLRRQDDSGLPDSLLVRGKNLSGIFHPSLDPMLESLQARINRKIAILPLALDDGDGKLESRPVEPPLYVPLSLAWNTRHFLTREALDLKSALLG